MDNRKTRAPRLPNQAINQGHETLTSAWQNDRPMPIRFTSMHYKITIKLALCSSHCRKPQTSEYPSKWPLKMTFALVLSRQVSLDHADPVFHHTSSQKIRYVSSKPLMVLFPETSWSRIAIQHSTSTRISTGEAKGEIIFHRSKKVKKAWNALPLPLPLFLCVPVSISGFAERRRFSMIFLPSSKVCRIILVGFLAFSPEACSVKIFLSKFSSASPFFFTASSAMIQKYLEAATMEDLRAVEFTLRMTVVDFAAMELHSPPMLPRTVKHVSAHRFYWSC